jgi:hypothetical protein
VAHAKEVKREVLRVRYETRYMAALAVIATTA